MTWNTASVPPGHAGPTTYRTDIDGLRAIAVLSVVLHHLSPSWLPGGFVGVDVFFVISGYLITGILVREMAQGRFSFLRFYERRARRIFPALFAVLAATLAVSVAVMLPTDFVAAVRGALGALLFVSNVVFWQMDTGYFEETDSRTNPFLHTWSLGIEEQFYVAFPLFLLAVHAWARRHMAAVLAACALLSFMAAAVLIRSNVDAVFYLSPFRAWELLVGALLAAGAVPPVRSARWREVLVAGGIGAILLACFLYDEETLFPGATALLPVLGAAAVIHAGTSGPTSAGRVLSLQPMVYVGLISYSLYLWHWPVLVLAEYLHGMEPVTEHAALLLALSVLLASASYHWVEQPLRRLAPPELRGRGLRQTTACAAAIGAFCVAGLATAGFPGRLDPSIAELDAVRMQPLPYRECSDRSPQDACRLGTAGVEPSVLLWGDSHLMAIAPAIHELLAASNVAAVFVPATGCAPLFDVDSRIKPSCRTHAARLREFMAAQPDIQTVLLSSFWSTYFRQQGPLWAQQPRGERLEGSVAGQKGLHATVQWLLQAGRRVVLLGPVPTFDKSVPAALAMQARDGVVRLDLSAASQRGKNAPFLEAVESLPRSSGLRYIDPLKLMCTRECTVSRGGRPLYMDAHHLSRHGAESLREHLAKAMGLPPRP